MDPGDIHKTRKNLILLKDRLGKQLHDLDRIIDILIENEIFQFNKKEDILAGKTDSEKMDNFLRCLWASGPNAYGQFRAALLSFADSRYEDVVSALDNTDLYTRREGTITRRPNTQQSANPYWEVTSPGAMRPTSVMADTTDALKDQLASLTSKMDQVLDSQAKMSDSQAKMSSSIASQGKSIDNIEHSQKEGTKQFERTIKKLEREKTELTEKYDLRLDTLRQKLTSVKAQLDEKNKRVFELLQKNESLKKDLANKDVSRIHSKNNDTINQLRNEIKVLNQQKEKLERDNTVLKQNSSLFLKPHPKALAALPQLQKQPASNRTYQDLHLKTKNKKL